MLHFKLAIQFRLQIQTQIQIYLQRKTCGHCWAWRRRQEEGAESLGQEEKRKGEETKDSPMKISTTLKISDRNTQLRLQCSYFCLQISGSRTKDGRQGRNCDQVPPLYDRYSYQSRRRGIQSIQQQTVGFRWLDTSVTDVKPRHSWIQWLEVVAKYIEGEYHLI